MLVYLSSHTIAQTVFRGPSRVPGTQPPESPKRRVAEYRRCRLTAVSPVNLDFIIALIEWRAGRLTDEMLASRIHTKSS